MAFMNSGNPKQPYSHVSDPKKCAPSPKTQLFMGHFFKKTKR